MSDHITVLRTTPTPQGAPRFATKRWVWNATLNDWRLISYDAGGMFTAEEAQVASVDDVATVLDRVRRDPTAFIVRGELIAEAREALASNPKLQFRRRKKIGKDGRAPHFAEANRQWLMVDVDGYPLSGSMDLAADPEQAIESAIHDLLPECFHDVRCFWQLSSSAGFVAGILKAHLFFWLAEPISNEDLKLYLHAYAPGVDRAPYNAVQPHYIADPVIQGGHDPLPRRTGWVKGLEDEVVLPELDLAALRATVRDRRERVATGAGLDPSAARTISGALALLGDDEGHEGWHAPLRRATWLYARQTPPQSRDDEALKEACREAIHAAVLREAHRKHAQADINRFCSDAYLDALIDGAFVWVEANKTDAPIGAAPFHEAPAHDLYAARATLREQISDFLSKATGYFQIPEAERRDPWHLGLAVDVGGGKSRAGRELVTEWSAQQRAAGLPHRVLWLGPTTKLNAEALEAFAEQAKKHDISIAMHRGREQDDPERPGDAMCLDLEAVKLASSAGESVERTVCGGSRDGEGAVCPFKGVCGYYRQATPVSQADIVIAAHEAAFHTPAGAKKGRGLTVFDESFWQDGLLTGRSIGVEGLASAVLSNPVFRHLPGGRQAEDDEATNDLHVARAKLERALMASPEGYLRKDVLVAAGLTVAECGEARKHEWARRRENLMRPGMAADDRRKAAEDAGVNALIPRFAAMWTVLADLLDGEDETTGRAEMLWRKDREGNQQWSLCLNTVSNLAGGLAEAPVLLLDATMPADLVRAYLPRLEAAEPVRVKAPHMEVRQIRGGWGKTTLLPGGLKLTVGEDGQPAQRLPPLLASLRDFVIGQTRGERTLVVTYLDAEAAFAGIPGVETAHFNDVAGRDEWKDVRHLFVIGRPRPRSDQVRVLAAALTGKPVEVAESHKETRGVRMLDGKTGAVEVRAYANPSAEAVSAAITDGEIVQAIGRGRGINRTEADPLRVWIMADVVTPLIVDELLDWRDLAPSAVERMALRGILLASPADAHAAYPDIFSTPKAAEHAIQRAGIGKADFPPNPLRISLLRGMGAKSPLRFTYRPQGRGQQTRRGWARPDMSPADLWEWLRSICGDLAHFQCDEPEPPPASPGERPADPQDETPEPSETADHASAPAEPTAPPEWFTPSGGSPGPFVPVGGDPGA